MVKPKAKRTSKVKLGNKASNKKNKFSGTKNKDMEKYQFKKKNIGKKGAKGTLNKTEKKTELSKKIDYSRDPSEDEMDIDDVDISDDDMKTYLQSNSKNMSFLSQNLNGEAKPGRRSNNKDILSLFEVIPRKSSNLYNEDVSTKDTVDLLPIKGEKGLIQRKGQRNAVEEEKVENENEEDHPENVEEGQFQQDNEPKSVIELLAAYREEINKKKLKIAQLSMDVVEDPYGKITVLKQILQFSEKEESLTIRKLSLFSLLEVFKDIIPSYRIRELTEHERNIKVSKDVRKIRDFEEHLLRSYQKYLQNLEENVKDGVKYIKKKRNQKGKHFKNLLTLTNASLKCLSELLKHAAHFNFRKNIINVLVPYIGLSEQLTEAGDICFDAIKNALSADYSGNVALDVVSFIQNLAKTKPNINPKVLETLLYLRVDADLIHATEQKGNKIERIKAKQEAIKKMSRKEKKRKKVEDKLNQELQEAEAVENRDRIGKTHTEVLKRLFVIYFRVLKLGEKSTLLTIVLKGLAKFSHLINIDFFGDLMNCLETILKYEDLDTQDRLHCILTALKVLSSQGDVLTIDPRQFYTELYNVLLNFDSEIDATCFDSVKECLDIMLIKRRKQVSHPQILGYLKRISTILLQMPTERLSDMFLLLRSIFQLYEKCDYLLDNENFGRGVFQPDIVNPEHSNADSTALWELPLLTRCYAADAELYCKHILNGAPSHGPGSLPQRLLQRGTMRRDEKISYDAPEYMETIPKQVTTKKKAPYPKKTSDEQLNEQYQTNRIYESVDGQTIEFITKYMQS